MDGRRHYGSPALTATSKVGRQTGQKGPNPLRGFWDTLLCPFGGFPEPRSTCPTSNLASTLSAGRPNYAFLRTRCILGKARTSSGIWGSWIRASIRVARFLERFPPNTRAMLKSERLPQTRHISWGLSLTTSHSAHNTAFCSATALRTRPRSGAPSTSEPFITASKNYLDCI